MRCLGLDIGDRRIGVALSDPLGILASPLLVFEHSDDAGDIATILEMVERYGVEYIIVGLPQSMDGTLGKQAEKVVSFSVKLKQCSPVPVEHRDERLSTVEARDLMMEAGPKKHMKNKKIRYDAAAAAVILQSFLNEVRPLQFPADENPE